NTRGGKNPSKSVNRYCTSSKFNTISKSLFDKLKSGHGIRPTCDPVKKLYEDAIGEINCLDLQFRHKGKWQSLDGTDAIDFEIRKNPTFDLVLGQGWLWVHEVKMSFKFSHRENFDPLAKIEINGMSTPLINKDSRPTGDSSNHKVSFTRNNLSKSTEAKPGLAQEEQRIFHNIPPVPPSSRKLNDDVSKNSGASKIKKYPKVDLDDGCGKLSIKTHLNNIWKSVHSIENNIEYGIFEKLRIIEYELSCINKAKLPWIKSETETNSFRIQQVQTGII
ncbi:1703_t:CDS:2, partial [Acaulospora colombiana]